MKILIAINKDLEWTKAETAVVYRKALCWNIVEETEENPENLIHRFRFVGRDSNLPLLEGKEELLPFIVTIYSCLVIDCSKNVSKKHMQQHENGENYTMNNVIFRRLFVSRISVWTGQVTCK